MAVSNALFSRWKDIYLSHETLAGSTAADRRSTDRQGGELRGFRGVVEAILEKGH